MSGTTFGPENWPRLVTACSLAGPLGPGVGFNPEREAAMDCIDDRAVSAARQAYMRALASGARKRIAFDVACAAYRVSYPAMKAGPLHRAVAAGIAISGDDLVAIERGDAA
jgi:hypothetical protein